MANRTLAKTTDRTPSVFDDFFKPWNEWFNNGDGFWDRMKAVPAVNIAEGKDAYLVSLVAPGFKKDDFKVHTNGNMLTISCEKEENKEKKEEKFTRKEYNFSSFSRSFTLPEDVNRDKIEARYEDGLLKITLPYNKGVKKDSAKQVAVK